MGGGGGAAIMIMRSIFTQASVQLYFLCFSFHSAILFSFFFFFFGFLHHCHCETTPLQRGYHYTYIRCYIPLHCVTSGQQSCFSDFRPMRSVYSPFLPCRLSQYLTRFKPKTLLWIVQRHALALYIDLDTFTLLPGWIILMNLGARRQKSQVLRPCFGPCQLFFVNCMRATCFIISGLKHGKLDIRWE